MAKPTGRSFFFSQGSDVTRVCVSRTSLRYQCCGARFGTGIGIPQTGNRAYRKSVCVCSRPVGARTRKTGLAGAWRVGSLVSIIIIVRSGRFQLLFSLLSLSLSSPPLFPGRAKEDLFSLARIHARTSPVHAARATLVCGMHMYAAFYEFKCEQRGPGGSSFRHFSRRASKLPRGSEMDLLPEEEISFGTKILFYYGWFNFASTFFL